jgi:hypothetical protein
MPWLYVRACVRCNSGGQKTYPTVQATQQWFVRDDAKGDPADGGPCAACRPSFLLRPSSQAPLVNKLVAPSLRSSVNRFPPRLSARVGGARLGPGARGVVSCARLLWKAKLLASSNSTVNAGHACVRFVPVALLTFTQSHRCSVDEPSRRAWSHCPCSSNQPLLPECNIAALSKPPPAAP